VQTFPGVEHSLTKLRKNIRIFESKVKKIMGFTRNEAIEAARQDLAKRLGIDEDSVEEVSVTDKDFPDMSLGAPVEDEMAAQMISTGWQIEFGVNGDTYEYRADKFHIRLVDFEGQNYVVD